MKPAMRLAALNRLPVIFVFTHDSIGVGEDGPTHQPIEHLAALRSMPGMHVVRPGDPLETAEAWRHAMTRTDGPTTLVLSRQTLPVLPEDLRARASELSRGAYVLADADRKPDAILLATGSEVPLALEAGKVLADEGHAVRVVSMPCWEAFEAQDEAYREEVLPADVKARVAVEAAAPFGWHRWIGSEGAVLGIDGYGASAPGGELLERYGFTVEAVAAAVRERIASRAGVPETCSSGS